MNNFNKPKLVDNNLLKIISQKKTKTQQDFLNNILNFFKYNFFIILFISLFSYFLYYRYNLTLQKHKERQEYLEYLEQLEQQKLNNAILQNEEHTQTRFTPENKQYAVPAHPNQPPYLKTMNEQTNEEINNPINIHQSDYNHDVAPINFNNNNLYNTATNNYHSNNYVDKGNYTLEDQKASFLPPQYIGHNFAPIN